MQIRDLFWSVIAWGIAYAVILAAAGVAFDSRLAVGMAVLLAGSAYVVQVCAHAQIVTPGPVWSFVGYIAWATSVCAGVVGLFSLFWGY